MINGHWHVATMLTFCLQSREKRRHAECWAGRNPRCGHFPLSRVRLIAAVAPSMPDIVGVGNGATDNSHAIVRNSYQCSRMRCSIPGTVLAITSGPCCAAMAAIVSSGHFPLIRSQPLDDRNWDVTSIKQTDAVKAKPPFAGLPTQRCRRRDIWTAVVSNGDGSNPRTQDQTHDDGQIGDVKHDAD